MLPNTKPPNREWYLDRCVRLSRTIDKPGIMPPFLVAEGCLSVLIQIYGGTWRVLWVLLVNRLNNDWDRIKDSCWWSWHTYIMLRTRAETMEKYEIWLEKFTGYDCREWPDEIEIDDEIEQPSTSK